MFGYSPDFSMSIGDFIAILISFAAITISIISAIKQNKLNDLLISKELEKAENSKRALLEARLVKISNGNYRVKIFNIGESPAQNVNFVFVEPNIWLLENEIESKFPCEEIMPRNGIELIAAPLYKASAITQTIKLTWEDRFSQVNEKTYKLSI